jgi:hypothetical protein
MFEQPIAQSQALNTILSVVYKKNMLSYANCEVVYHPIQKAYMHLSHQP